MEILKEYMSVINGVLSLTVLGFILKITSVLKASFKEKEDILNKRIDLMSDDLKKTEKWANRDKDKLIEEREEYRKKLELILSDAKIDLQSYNILDVVKSVNSDIKDSIKELTDKIENMKYETNGNNIELNLSMAKAFATNGDWNKTAQQFEIVTRTKDDSWELYFSQGVAFANSRMGKTSDLKSLQSYSSAIAYLPEDANPNTKARLYIYRGALLKRLKRSREAENDIKIGIENATEAYEKNDGLYNLACVYAMQNRIEEFNEIKENLKSNNINNVILEKLGIYSETAKIDLYLNKSENNSIFKDYNSFLLNDKDTDIIKIDVITLEDIIQKHNLKQIDFLKMDCEGAEYPAILSTNKKTFDKIKVISMGFHDLKTKDYTGLKIVNHLEKNGFYIFRFAHYPTTINNNYGRIIAIKK